MSVDFGAIDGPSRDSSPSKHRLDAIQQANDEFNMTEEVKESKVRKHLFKFLASLI